MMKNFLAGLVCVLIGGGLAWLMVPSVWADLTVDKDALQRAPKYAVTEAECEVKAFVLSSCDLEFTHRGTSDTVSMDYMLFGNYGGEEVYAMQTPDKSYVTSNVGIDTIWNRVAMMVVLVGLMLGGGLFLLIQMARGKLPAQQAKKNL